MTIEAARPWLASYAPNVPTEFTPPEGSLIDLVETSASLYPAKVALEFFGGTVTYAELRDRINRAAEGLRLLGVRHGDPVALILPNCPEHVVAFYAVLRLGAVVVEHNPLYTPRELRHQFEDHGAQVAIAWDKVVPTLQEMPADVGPPAIISVDITRGMSLVTRAALLLPVRKARESRDALTASVSGATPWQQIVTSPLLDPDHTYPVRGDLAVLQYTSGTVGRPKGAELTHGNLTANAAQSRSWAPTIEQGNCVVYAVLPMFHAYGLTLCLTFAMSMGATLVMFPKFDADLVLKAIKKRPPTFFPAVPPICARLAARALEKGVSLAGIEIAISGAMNLPTAIVEPWEAQTGGFLVEGYGLSEASPVLMVNPVSDGRKAGTVGIPIPGTEARIVDPANPTVDVAPGAEGELIVRGPQIFRGYHQRPEETAAVFVDGDWFRTGDIATMDDDGFFSIVDRIKELIITGGFNVSPSEVEDAIRKAPGVIDAAVVGIPSPNGGEDVVAAVEFESGATFDEQALRSFVRDLLTPYKVPKRIVQLDQLPKSMMGKTLRRVVREQFPAAVAQADAAGV